MERIVQDIVFDFSVKPRLNDDRGTAMLVASSIYEACRYYELFQKTAFRGKCAVITSYNPQTRDITLEDTGANTDTAKQFLYNTYTELLKNVGPRPNMTKTETYEEDAKERFKTQPANMKLLVVVDKLLTGFDAPSCTYLYIDKKMQDHGLFQAICRTNRLDGDDKDFGYIVDYKDLFKRVENVISVYSSELDHDTAGADPEALVQDRLTKGRERLDDALEALALLCEPVQPPCGELEYIHYFCGNTEIPEELADYAPRRVALYKATATLLRSYASIADELEAAGYSTAEIDGIKADLDRYVKLREIIRRASGETIDLKAYEADMRHLIDTYIEADEPRKISPFDNMSLLELIVKSGIAEAIENLPEGLRSDQNAIAETIANNVRSKIVKEHLNDPAYYDKMSALLAEIIADLKAKRIEYAEYLKRIADLARRVVAGQEDDTPPQLTTPGLRALYNNLSAPGRPPGPATRVGQGAPNAGYSAHGDPRVDMALKIDAAVKRVRQEGWRGYPPREKKVKGALFEVLKDEAEVERIFLIIKAQSEY